MAKSKYRTAPELIEGIPPGIPYIISNEAAERFSFYGMRTILVIFMTTHLMGRDGELAVMSEADARGWYHTFQFAAYFLPIAGALLSDVLLGKYRTIILLSIVYCLGHLALAVDETRLGLGVGLALIAVGSGGIKPCVSAHVGDQFGARNEHLLSKVFGWFYFSINFGAAISALLTPVLLRLYGPAVAFGVPGVLMFVATVAFWMGRNKFVHIPAAGIGFVREVFGAEGRTAALKLAAIFVFVAIFWSLYDQTGSAWVLQATRMDLNLLGREWLPSQITAVNPVLILIYIPLFTFVIYPAVNRIFLLTPLRKISIGLFITAASFTVPAWVETRLAAGETPNIVWHIVAYLLITAAEVLVSITSLEFAYTQAPNKMKSFIMSLYLLSISLGNAVTATVNFFIQNEDGTSKLEGPAYYWFFTGMMLVAAVIFIFVAMAYRERRYIQKQNDKPQ